MTDMTTGSPRRHLWQHALPLLLGNWLQLSYNAVDAMIAGRFIGKTALAAEGIAGPVMNLLILAISGLCIGAGVLISEAYGAKNFHRLRKTMANTLSFGLILCAVLAVLGVGLTPQLLRFLEVPQDIYAMTAAYLRITFLGAPFTFCYNALGVNAIAAFNAVTRVDDFACIPEQSISSAISTYIAQNRGAKKENRIRVGFRTGIALEICYWVLICTLVWLLRNPLVSLFISGEDAAAVTRLGCDYLGIMSFFYLFPALTNGMQGFFRGMGKMRVTVLGTFIQTSIRTLCTFLLAPRLGIVGIAFSCAIGWSAMLLFEVPYYFFTCKKQNLPALAQDPETTAIQNNTESL